jgi:hypothetical protein
VIRRHITARAWATGLLATAVTAGALLAAAAGASARGTYDLRGNWSVAGTGGGDAGVIKITAMNLATGAFSGTSYGNAFKVKGVETGTHVVFTQSESGYTSTDKATVSGSGKRMSGTWHDTNGSGGTWTAVKTSSPAAAKKKATSKKKKTTGKKKATSKKKAKKGTSTKRA